MDDREEGKWWVKISYNDAKNFIRENISSIANSYIAIGYYLRTILVNEEYKEDGYQSIHEFADHEFGMKRQTVDHCMRINRRFSKGGNSPVVAEEYKGFKKTQLQEMLYLTEDQIQEVQPDMTVRQIRELGKDNAQEKESGIPCRQAAGEKTSSEKLSALGFPRREYSKDSLIKTFGCGANDCLSCHRQCDIRQEKCWCVDAMAVSPFPCSMLEKLPDLRKQKGEVCQFVNLGLAYQRAGDKEPVPCCKNCMEACSLRCPRSALQPLNAVASEIKNSDEEVLKEAQKETCSTSSDVKQALEEQNKAMKKTECLRQKEKEEGVGEITLERVLKEETEKLIHWERTAAERGEEAESFKAKQDIIVSALSRMVKTETKAAGKPQLELPKLKNKQQRQEWIRNYKSWPIWTKNLVIEETLYRYDLPDGFAFVIRHFPYTRPWKNEETECQRYYLLEPGYRHLAECASNMTEMAEHLKELQKGKSKNEA